MKPGDPFWVLETGLTSTPVYFCMKMAFGRPVFSFMIERAHRFPSAEAAEMVRNEWDLDPEQWRGAEHIMEPPKKA